ncbi:MAG: glycosyltransferase family 39 protein, partial [Bacteroidota bacterium]
FGDISVGVVAGATIVSFKAYTITHGMRSADFDALLIFFLVAQAFCFYQWVVTDRRKYLWLAALAVFLGMMTKGVAGGFYLPGIGIWFLLTRAGRKKLLDPGLYLSVGGAIGIMVGYYFLREHLDPGYFAQVTKNELSGRYVEHERQYTFFFHLERLYNGRYFRHLFLAAVVAIPVGLFGPHRRETLFVSVVGAAFLVVISGSAVKHYWYSFPILPMLGLLAGLLVWRVYTYVKEKTTTRLGAVAYALLVVGLFTQPAYHLTQRVLAPREHQVSKPKHIPYRPAMRAFGGVRNYTVLAEDYNPTARFYVALERERGKNVQLRCWAPKVPPDASKPLLELTAAPGDTVLACHQVTRDYLRDNYSFTTYGKAGDCSMVVITGE